MNDSTSNFIGRVLSLGLAVLGLFACSPGAGVSGDEAAEPDESMDNNPNAGWPKVSSKSGPGELDAALVEGNLPTTASLDVRSFLARHDFGWALRDCEQSLCVSTHLATWTGFDGSQSPRYYMLAGLHLPTPVATMPIRQHVAFVIALGGSNATARHRDVQDALVNSMSNLAVDDLVTLVAARTDAEILFEASAPNSQQVSQTLAKYIGSEESNSYDGLRHAYEAIERTSMQQGQAVARVVLITDGSLNTGLFESARVEELVASQGRIGVGLSVVGLGASDEVDVGELHTLAQAGGGQWRWVQSGTALTVAVQEELTRRWSLGPARAQLSLRAAMGTSIAAVYGARTTALSSQGATLEFAAPHAEQGHPFGIAQVMVELVPDGNRNGQLGELEFVFPEASSKLVSHTTVVAFPPTTLPIPGTPLFTDESAQRAFVALETFLAFERIALASEVGDIEFGLRELDAMQPRLTSWLAAMNLAVPGEFAEDAKRADLMRANLEDRLPD